MAYKQVMTLALAQIEVEKLIELKKITPKRREAIENPLEYMVEGVQLGFITIADDGAITQTLSEPFDSLTELKYAARVPAASVQAELNKLTVQSVAAKTTLYIKLYTGLLATQINKLEPTDRNYADAISLFFM